MESNPKDVKQKSSKNTEWDFIPELRLQDSENEDEEEIECEICKTMSRRMLSDSQNRTPPAPTPHHFYRHEDLRYYEGAQSPRTPTNQPPAPTSRYIYKQEESQHYESAKSSRTLTYKPPVPTPHNNNKREVLRHYESDNSLRASKNRPTVPTPQNFNKREDLKHYESYESLKTPPFPTPQNTLENGNQKNREDLKVRGKPSTTSSKPMTYLRSGEEIKAIVLMQIKEQEALERIKSMAKKAESKTLAIPSVKKTIPETTDRDIQENKCDTSEKSMPTKPSPGKMDFHINADDIARTTIYNPLTRHFQRLFLNVRERQLTMMEELEKMPAQIDEIHRNAAAGKKK